MIQLIGLILIVVAIAWVLTIGSLSMSLVYYAVSGLIVGALARLVLPGRERIGWVGTVLVGIGGGAIGGMIGSRIGAGQLVELALSVGAAAVLLIVLGFRAR